MLEMKFSLTGIRRFDTEEEMIKPKSLKPIKYNLSKMKQEKKCAWGEKEQSISYTWDNIKQCYTHTHTQTKLHRVKS